jgi:hypothetical protein
MRRALLTPLVSLTFAMSSLYATTQNLSISGPPTWTPGASVVLSVQDSFSGFGGGSYGLSYWLQVSSAIAPFLTITDVTHCTFCHDEIITDGLPYTFTSTSGADPGFLSTMTANGRSGDLGCTTNPLVLVPDGSYPVNDITFLLSGDAPIGTYTLRTTTANPRGSIQVTSDFTDAPFPQASFVFTVVPEPNTLALIALTGVGAGVMAYRRRK